MTAERLEDSDNGGCRYFDFIQRDLELSKLVVGEEVVGYFDVSISK